ncbi:MAG: Nif3-like dinuclear metal center hexameric protein [Clostridia bacterium]|nr:Nif3-like dinuclear metal center hexameric protein [Clostridia bacterium]
MINCKTLFERLEDFAPVSLSDKLCEIDGHYDNSGIILDCQNQTDKILFCLDLTGKSVEYAIEKGCGIIVTHHPAIYRPIKNLKGENPVLKCALNGVSVISMHLNFDSAKTGIDYWLSQGLGGYAQKILTSLGDGTGYGRVAQISSTVEKIAQSYKKEFNTQKVFLYGDEQKPVKKIASFCGAGFGDGEIGVCLAEGVDMVVSADIPHHVLISAIESGLAVLSCTHYSTENYGMKKIADEFSKRLNEKIYFFDDERFV